MSEQTTFQFVSDGRGGVRRSPATLRPGPDEILMRTLFAAVNRGDVLGLAGAYGPPPPDGQPLGQDVVGVVDAVGSEAGPGVTGQTVFGQITGAWGSHAIAQAADVAPLGDLDPQVAVTLPLPGFTALRLHRDVCRHVGELRDRDVLITGGTGAVGGLLTSLLTGSGARVWVLDRRLEKDDEPSPGRVRRIARLQDAPPVDVLFESVGGTVLRDALHLLRPGAHAWWFGEVTREPVTLNFFDYLGSPWQLHHFSSWVHDGDTREDLIRLAQLVRDGVLTPPASTVIPAQDLPDAVRRISDGRTHTKIVLDFRSSSDQ